MHAGHGDAEPPHPGSPRRVRDTARCPRLAVAAQAVRNGTHTHRTVWLWQLSSVVCMCLIARLTHARSESESASDS